MNDEIMVKLTLEELKMIEIDFRDFEGEEEQILAKKTRRAIRSIENRPYKPENPYKKY